MSTEEPPFYSGDRPGPVGPTDAARNPPTSVGSVGVPGRGTGAAPHFYWARPVTLCTDNLPDGDEGPPNWGDR